MEALDRLSDRGLANNLRQLIDDVFKLDLTNPADETLARESIAGQIMDLITERDLVIAERDRARLRVAELTQRPDPSDVFVGLPLRTFTAVLPVLVERQAQQKQWGDQFHDWAQWAAILGEEYGEACQEINRLTFQGSSLSQGEWDATLGRLKAEMADVAAVCLQVIENIDELGDVTVDSGRDMLAGIQRPEPLMESSDVPDQPP